MADADQEPARVRRSADRYLTRSAGCTSRHSFSFGAHYDPADVGHGPLVAINDETCAAGAGYGRHVHESVELVTWVVEGRLRHEHGDHSTTVLGADAVQVLAVPGRVEHAETNAAANEPVRFVQVWLLLGEDPSDVVGYQVGVADFASAGPAWTVLAASAPAPAGALTLRTPGVTVSAGRLESGSSVPLPRSGYAHLLVVRGLVSLGEDVLAAGDAVQVTGRASSASLVATAPEPSDLLLCAVGG